MKLFTTDTDYEAEAGRRIAARDADTQKLAIEIRSRPRGLFDFTDPNFKVVSVQRGDFNRPNELTMVSYYRRKDLEKPEPFHDSMIHTFYLWISREQHEKVLEEWLATLNVKIPEPTPKSKQLLKG
jgi:hypothetical protein